MYRILVRILRKLGIIHFFKLSASKKINGRNIRIPILNGIGINNFLQLSEPWMIKVLANLIEANNTNAFLDVGINIGQTLIKLKSIDPSIEYVGFEPNPICNYYLNALIQENRFQNVECYPVGISDKTEVLDLNLYDDSLTNSSASIIRGFRGNDSILKKTKVPVFRFSALKMELRKFSLIKIDVEGAELEVLKALRDKIGKDRPIILIEILPVYSIENHFRLKRQNEIEAIVSMLNYKILRVRKEKGSFIGVDEISQIGINSNLENCDYIFVPSESFEKIKSILNS